MKLLPRICTLAALTLAAALAGAANAAGPAMPEKAAACTACHGEGGVSSQPQLYPSLAGQYANYLEHALQEYRAGSRKNPIMAGQAANLTDADIRQLAGYFAAQKGPLYVPSIPRPQKPQ